MPSPIRLRSKLPWLLVAATLGLLVAPVLDPGVQLFYRDTAMLYYPVKAYLAERLRHGELPLWDPWTEAGTSVLGQVTPALFHPLTLLYLVFPFDLAFKLNHLLPLGLAAWGAWLLARRLGCSPWACAVAALGYSCSGYVLSMASSNLIYSVGLGTLPLGIDRLVACVERPGAGRLAVAALVLGSCVLGGEPQSLLFAGLIGGVWALAAAWKQRPGPRSLATACAVALAAGVLALTLSGPASFPALASLSRSHRAKGLLPLERAMFANTPPRLAGLALPALGDDLEGDEAANQEAGTVYGEYFANIPGYAFAPSILLGAPLLLLALAGACTGPAGRALALGGSVLALGSTGMHLGIYELLCRIPGFALFRYAEKLIGPASLLFALAAALGAERVGTDRAARRCLAGASLVALLLCLCGLAFEAVAPRALLAGLAGLGATHRGWLAAEAVRRLHGALVQDGLFSLSLALAAGLSARRGFFRELAALAQAGAVLAAQPGQLEIAPVELFHQPPTLASRLVAEAGPSASRWRIASAADVVPLPAKLSSHLAVAYQKNQQLNPQSETLWHIEGVSPYFSANDDLYLNAWTEAPAAYADLLTVGYIVLSVRDVGPREASRLGFVWTPPGRLLRRLSVQPRVFLAPAAVAVEERTALAFLRREPGLVRQRAILEPQQRALAAAVRGGGTARFEAASPERATVQVAARGPSVLVWGEHFDPGWRAEIDGHAAPSFPVDLTLVGVAVPEGRHRVSLRFVPQGLLPGVVAAALSALVLGLLGWTQRGRRAKPRHFR